MKRGSHTVLRAIQKIENVLIGEFAADPDTALDIADRVLRIAFEAVYELEKSSGRQHKDIAPDAMREEFRLMEVELCQFGAVIGRSAADALQSQGANDEFGQTAEETIALLLKAADKLKCLRGGDFDFRSMLKNEGE